MKIIICSLILVSLKAHQLADSQFLGESVDQLFDIKDFANERCIYESDSSFYNLLPLKN
jgi:hypothetical protein